jgi:hypothetical protein
MEKSIISHQYVTIFQTVFTPLPVRVASVFATFSKSTNPPVQNGVFSDQSKSRNLLTKENQTWKWCGFIVWGTING